MIQKTILTAVIILCCISSYAQSNKSIITEFTPNHFVVKSQKISDLANYNWVILKEIYKSNPPYSEIKIEVKYDENGTFDYINKNDFTQIYECKSSDLEEIISKLNNLSVALKSSLKN